MTDIHLMNWMPRVGDTVYQRHDGETEATVVAVSGQLVWLMYPYPHYPNATIDERQHEFEAMGHWGDYNDIVHVNTIIPFWLATDGGAA